VVAKSGKRARTRCPTYAGRSHTVGEVRKVSSERWGVRPPDSRPATRLWESGGCPIGQDRYSLIIIVLLLRERFLPGGETQTPASPASSARPRWWRNHPLSADLAWDLDDGELLRPDVGHRVLGPAVYADWGHQKPERPRWGQIARSGRRYARWTPRSTRTGRWPGC